jgi:predicted PurR-regulated permease PerM
MDGSKPPPKQVAVDIPFTALLKVAVFALGTIILYRLFPLILLCFLAILLAMATEPVIISMQRWMRRGYAVTILILCQVLVSALFVFFICPPLYQQFARIIAKAPSASTSLLNHIPKTNPLHNLFSRVTDVPTAGFATLGEHILTLGQGAIEGLVSVVLVMVILAYLLIDGGRIAFWILGYFDPRSRQKALQTAVEVTPLISAYVVGQIITSLLASIFVYAVFKSLGIPAALVMAFLAGLLDILPVVGFILTVIPSLLFALTVSPKTALMVLALLCTYHALEAYLIVPFVYGNRLRVSGLVVLLAILVGVSVAGIVGAIVILPVVACYPIFEKIWFPEWKRSNKPI